MSPRSRGGGPLGASVPASLPPTIPPPPYPAPNMRPDVGQMSPVRGATPTAPAKGQGAPTNPSVQSPEPPPSTSEYAKGGDVKPRHMRRGKAR